MSQANDFASAFEEGEEKAATNPAVALRHQRQETNKAVTGEFTAEFDKEEAPATEEAAGKDEETK
jgi:hypothetical protein